MNIYILILLSVIVILMFFKNSKGKKSLQRDAGYADAYTKVLRNDEDAYEHVDRYVEEETIPELKNKARIVQVYCNLLQDKNPSSVIDQIDFKEIFCDGDKFMIERITRNSDGFIWLLLDLSKARSKSMVDIMEKLYDKVFEYEPELSKNVEYNVFRAGYEIMLEKGTFGIEFLKKLLAGEYSDYSYDKQIIGVYKKMAASLLVYSGEPINEEDKDILIDFSTTQVGNKFMKDLDILDEYLPKKEEEKPEEIGELYAEEETSKEETTEDKEEEK